MAAEFILFNRFTCCINEILFVLHEMKYVSYHKKWDTFRIMRNERSFALCEMKEVSHYTRWKTSRVIRNERCFVLYEMKDSRVFDQKGGIHLIQ